MKQNPQNRYRYSRHGQIQFYLPCSNQQLALRRSFNLRCRLRMLTIECKHTFRCWISALQSDCSPYTSAKLNWMFICRNLMARLSYIHEKKHSEHTHTQNSAAVTKEGRRCL